MIVKGRKGVAEVVCKKLGLKMNYSDGGREYWWKGDGSDALLDHSVTVDPLGDNEFWISAFGWAKEALQGEMA